MPNFFERVIAEKKAEKKPAEKKAEKKPDSPDYKSDPILGTF